MTQVVAFGPLEISYDDTVLEPRDWTRMQARWAAHLLTALPPGPVLELCTGAGHIGLLAVHGTGRRLIAVDASPEACRWARHNAAANGIDVEVREGDMTAVLAPAERFPLVIADPPWVRRDQVGRFAADPVSAIDGGPDGLALARTCVDLIGRHLDDLGVALLQLGDRNQVERLGDPIHAAGLEITEHVSIPGRGLVAELRRAVTTAT